MSLPRAPLGTTGMDITRVGLGAWAIGGGDWQGGWGPQDDGDSVRAIHHAVERGVNWIDTAPAYGLGHAEEVVGRAIAQLPDADRPYVFTKCGLVWGDGERTVSNSLHPSDIRRECEESLRRLGVERLDLLQAHWPTWDDTPVEASWETMSDLVDEGKARAIGLSNFGVDALATCETLRHVDTYQPGLNLIVRDALAETIPWCRENHTGVIVYSPMRSGLLTGRFSEERAASLPSDDWRATHPDFQPPLLPVHLNFVDRLQIIAEQLGATVPELAIAWTLAQPGVTGAIVGARNPEQVDGWIRAADVTLTEITLDDLARELEATGVGHGPTRSGDGDRRFGIGAPR